MAICGSGTNEWVCSPGAVVANRQPPSVESVVHSGRVRAARLRTLVRRDRDRQCFGLLAGTRFAHRWARTQRSTILSTIAASMVSLAALVLTITMVVVQLAMGQFSPRIVQTFLRDKPSQIAVGLFVATFVHAMLTLREVQVGGGGSVPGLAILVVVRARRGQRGRARVVRPSHRSVACASPHLSSSSAPTRVRCSTCSTPTGSTAVAPPSPTTSSSPATRAS